MEAVERLEPARAKGPLSQRFQNLRCCQKCNAMTETLDGLRALLSKTGYEHFNSYEIQETAALGCALCMTLKADWDALDENMARKPIRIFAGPPSTGSGILTDSIEGIQLRYLVAHIPYILLPRRSDVEEDLLQKAFCLRTLDDDPASECVPGRPESKQLRPSVVAKIKKWLDDCMTEHPFDPPELPRRVLDLGTDDSSIRLHQSQTGERARYAALNYCWGSGTQHLTTTTSNLGDHLLALPGRLPQTISDAIEVCRKIGIRYLWVDALCIIQDDDGDKLDQIANMRSIFKESTLTIVAASAGKATDGFLTNEKQCLKPIAQLPIFVNESTSGTVYLGSDKRGHPYLDAEPLFERGWAFQELLLSPRIILFDSYQVSLKTVGSDFRPVVETLYDLVGKTLARRMDEWSESDRKEHQAQIWRIIIEQYSTKDLTFFEDRLPALAGIAADLAKVWNDVYIAGFWGKTIVQYLGWHRSRMREGPDFGGIDVTKRHGVPSWSWVSVPYGVDFAEPLTPDAELVSHDVKLISPRSPFGQVKSGRITLEARVLEVSDLPQTPCLPLPVLIPGYITLDFDDPDPNLDHYRLVYLGSLSFYQCIFMGVEKSGSGNYCRPSRPQPRKKNPNGKEVYLAFAISVVLPVDASQCPRRPPKLVVARHRVDHVGAVVCAGQVGGAFWERPLTECRGTKPEGYNCKRQLHHHHQEER
ncbi:heterokaryon incompatibility protein-domain-containing protein [Diplogelasinospora grovesii]|uniref:Heterokaryon incompatibility protein-domain-containing protein n=1 Tax=Diplogelasinospora grovesii TaxID=303347 RepID=A0AAN6S5U3_9PEZI|nr:heterokaryon incompatibility protein-domain-containing protein [Diplogelasinospora grovesii]